MCGGTRINAGVLRQVADPAQVVYQLVHKPVVKAGYALVKVRTRGVGFRALQESKNKHGPTWGPRSLIVPRLTHTAL